MMLIFRAILAFSLAFYMLHPREVTQWMQVNVLPVLARNGAPCPAARQCHFPPIKTAKTVTDH